LAIILVKALCVSDAGAADPNSAYTQSALTKIIANMSTLVAMWARISSGHQTI
jgi:citrate synthase